MLNQPPPTLVALLLGSAGLSFFLASWAWQHRKTNGGLEMAFMLAAAAIYTLGYSFEISRPDLEGAIAAIRFEYLGSVWVTPLFFAFAWRYTRERPLPVPLIAFIVLQAVSTLAVVWSPWMTSLFYASLRMDMSPPFPTDPVSAGAMVHRELLLDWNSKGWPGCFSSSGALSARIRSSGCRI